MKEKKRKNPFYFVPLEAFLTLAYAILAACMALIVHFFPQERSFVVGWLWASLFWFGLFFLDIVALLLVTMRKNRR